MPDISVEQFAKVVNISVNNLLSQLEKAGIVKKNKSDLISDEEKMQLLEFFRNNKNNINNNQKKENPVEDNLQNEKKVDVWAEMSPYALTVRFKKPNDKLVKKYSLSCASLNYGGEVREFAHIFVMPHVRKKIINQFLLDLFRFGY